MNESFSVLIGSTLVRIADGAPSSFFGIFFKKKSLVKNLKLLIKKFRLNLKKLRINFKNYFKFNFISNLISKKLKKKNAKKIRKTKINFLTLILRIFKFREYNATCKAGDNLLLLIITTNYHWRDVRFTCEFLNVIE